MAQIKTEDIVKLRQMTGAGMMNAKSALEEANGNLDEAVKILRKKGETTAAKKADRATEQGLIETYVHNGKIGVLLELGCETDFVARTEDYKNLAHDIAMHVAATAPQYLDASQIPEDVLAEKKAEFSEDAAGKPEEVAQKMIEGRLEKWYGEVCLLSQDFIKDPDVTIEKLVKQTVGKLGENITIRRFVRFELGESL